MKKKLLKLLAATLATTTLVAPMAACARNDFADGTSEKFDKKRTQVYVGVYNGGLGLDWFNQIKKDFEKAHPEYNDYQILPLPGKDEYNTDTLKGSILRNKQIMYFIDTLEYNQYVNNDLLLDISDVVTDTERVGGSIESNLDPVLANYYKRNGKYYMLGYYNDTFQISYDVDLFEAKEFFISEIDANGNITKWTGTGTKHTGQDGVAGTEDDGLPISYSQFFTLIDRIRTAENGKITPFTWNGANKTVYWSKVLPSIAAQVDGYTTTSAMYGTDVEEGVDITTITNFTKEHELGKFSSAEFETTTTTLKFDNYSDIFTTPGQYMALCFAKDLTYNADNYDSSAMSPGDSHLDAQERYLYSSYLNKPIAMFMDGGWWENEANATFTDMERDFGPEYSRYSRRFGVMTLPLSDDVYATGNYDASKYQHIYSPYSSSSACFIPKNCQYPELAKDLMAYFYSEEALKKFSEITGATRPVNYTMSTDELTKLSYYGQSLLKFYTRDCVKNVYRLPANSKLCGDTLGGGNTASFGTYITNVQYRSNTALGYSGDPIGCFFENKTYSPQTYFSGMKEYNQTDWAYLLANI